MPIQKVQKPLHSVSEYHVSVRKATVSQKWLSYLSKTYLKYIQKWTIRSHLCSTHCVWQFLIPLFPFFPYFFRLSSLWNWSPMCSFLFCFFECNIYIFFNVCLYVTGDILDTECSVRFYHMSLMLLVFLFFFFSVSTRTLYCSFGIFPDKVVTSSGS